MSFQKLPSELIRQIFPDVISYNAYTDVLTVLERLDNKHAQYVYFHWDKSVLPVYQDRCALMSVCKLWRNIAVDLPYLWSLQVFRNIGPKECNDLPRRMSQSGSLPIDIFIKVDSRTPPKPLNQFFDILAQYSHRIRILHNPLYSSTGIIMPGLDTVFRLGDNIVLPKLECLQLAGANRLQSSSSRTIHTPNLKCLDIRGHEDDGVLHFKALSDDTLRNLTSLAVRDSSAYNDAWEGAVEKLFLCQNLRELVWGWDPIDHLSDNAISALPTIFPHLHSMLIEAYHPTRMVCDPFPIHLRSLRILHFSFVSDLFSEDPETLDMTSLSTIAPQLEILTLGRWNLVASASSSSVMFSRLKRLEIQSFRTEASFWQYIFNPEDETNYPMPELKQLIFYDVKNGVLNRIQDAIKSCMSRENANPEWLISLQILNDRGRMSHSEFVRDILFEGGCLKVQNINSEEERRCEQHSSMICPRLTVLDPLTAYHELKRKYGIPSPPSSF